MGKQQLSTLDVAAEVAYLRQHAINMNLINVFDINAKTYILKLGISGDEGKKLFILLESGRRLHTTKYERSHSNFPSNFNLKLRKHIRNRRLNDIRQLGIDRVVDFTFGHEEKSIHLILEMFAQGNIILTDSKYDVLTLLRTHVDNDQNYCLMPKRPYPLDYIRVPKAIYEEELKNAFGTVKGTRTFKNIVSGLLPYGAPCAEHVLLSAGISPSEKPTGEFMNQPQLMNLMKQIKKLESWFTSCGQNPPEGYILLKESKEGGEKAVYSEFEPFLLFQHQNVPHIKFNSLDEALDEFFSKIEGQKLALAEAAAAAAAKNRLKKTKDDLEIRAANLREEAAKEDLQGQLIEYNLKEVEDVLLAVNTVLAQSLSWDEIAALIKSEAEAGNPVAGLILTLRLEQNIVIVHLENILEEREEGKKPQKVKVELDLSLGAAANARSHYEKRKKHVLKEQRTIEANEKALKAAEKKIKSELKKSKPQGAMHELRKMHWFEKFNWFITSENYLVISGRDAQQNDLLVKRYLRYEDIYVHADLHGASSTIIRNNKPGMMIPPISLQEAGNACVCRSKAWESKIVTSAWWVYSHQVSKSAPTGEYLTTGSFMIRGKKNYLPPVSLVYGFGFLFKLEDSSIANHKTERAPKVLEPQSEPAKLSNETEHHEEDMDISQDHQEERSALEAFLDGSLDTLSKDLDRSMSLTKDTVEDMPQGSQEQIGKKRISVKDKRKMKKAQQPFLLEKTIEEHVLEENSRVPEMTKPATKGKPSKKKGKRRDQDEEDRKLMTELLQSAGAKKTKQQRRDERKQKKATKKAELYSNEKLPTESDIQTMISKATDVPFAENVNLSQDSEVQSDREEVQILNSEDEEELQITEEQQLESLTGIPHSEDTVLFAVPVCAPYDALSSYRYKVKLLPGTLKKGKAAKQSTDLLVNLRNLPQRDITLIKEVPDSEITNVMLPAVKLAMPGMQKIKQNEKSKKKKAKQQQQQQQQKQKQEQ